MVGSNFIRIAVCFVALLVCAILAPSAGAAPGITVPSAPVAGVVSDVVAPAQEAPPTVVNEAVPTVVKKAPVVQSAPAPVANPPKTSPPKTSPHKASQPKASPPKLPSGVGKAAAAAVSPVTQGLVSKGSPPSAPATHTVKTPPSPGLGLKGGPVRPPVTPASVTPPRPPVTPPRPSIKLPSLPVALPQSSVVPTATGGEIINDASGVAAGNTVGDAITQISQAAPKALPVETGTQAGDIRPHLQQTLGSVTQMLSSAPPVTQGLGSKGTPGASPIRDSLADAGKTINDPSSELTSTVEGVTAALSNPGGAGFPGSLLGGIAHLDDEGGPPEPALTAIAGSLGGDLEGTLGATPGGLITGLGPTLDAIGGQGSLLEDVTGGLGSTVRNISSGLGSSLGGISDSLGSNLGGITGVGGLGSHVSDITGPLGIPLPNGSGLIPPDLGGVLGPGGILGPSGILEPGGILGPVAALPIGNVLPTIGGIPAAVPVVATSPFAFIEQPLVQTPDDASGGNTAGARNTAAGSPTLPGARPLPFAATSFNPHAGTVAAEAPQNPGPGDPANLPGSGAAAPELAPNGLLQFGFAALLLVALMAVGPALGRLIQTASARWRPVPFVALLERPG